MVFEGQVESTFASVNGRYNATFSVTKVLKGALPIPEGRKRPRPVEVGEFGPENAEACLTEVLIGSRYLVFVNSTSVSNYFVVTAFPGASTKKALRDIRSIVCTDCGELIFQHMIALIAVLEDILCTISSEVTRIEVQPLPPTSTTLPPT